MPKTQLFAKEVLELVFNGSSSSGIGDTVGISGVTSSFTIVLHSTTLEERWTAPGWSQIDHNEIAYDGYVRQTLTSSDWELSGSTMTNKYDIVFPAQFGVETPQLIASCTILIDGVRSYQVDFIPGTTYTGQYISPAIPAGYLNITEE